MNKLHAISLALVALSACGGATPTPGPVYSKPTTSTDAAPGTAAPGNASPDRAAPATGMAPPPFTAAQIREATKAGRTYLFRLTVPGRSPTPILRQMRFVHAHSKGGQLETRSLTADRKPRGEATTNAFTWAELVSHATYPKDATTITSETITVPAGQFDCLRYEVRQGPMVITAWFAKILPGAPVRHRTVKDGKLQAEMVLISHRHGG